MYKHKGKAILKLKLSAKQRPIYLFTQGSFEYYELGSRFYKVNISNKDIIPADRSCRFA